MFGPQTCRPLQGLPPDVLRNPGGTCSGVRGVKLVVSMAEHPYGVDVVVALARPSQLNLRMQWSSQHLCAGGEAGTARVSRIYICIRLPLSLWCVG
jgi:hypothetical protein